MTEEVPCPTCGEKDEIECISCKTCDGAGWVPAGWQPIRTAPRDGRNILICFGQDHVSQAKYCPGLPYPWQFIESNNGISWDINHARDNAYGPTHWMPMPVYA
jgi:hypothetical protein